MSRRKVASKLLNVTAFFRWNTAFGGQFLCRYWIYSTNNGIFLPNTMLFMVPINIFQICCLFVMLFSQATGQLSCLLKVASKKKWGSRLKETKPLPVATIWPPFEVEAIHFEVKRRTPRIAPETVLAKMKFLLPLDSDSQSDINR